MKFYKNYRIYFIIIAPSCPSGISNYGNSSFNTSFKLDFGSMFLYKNGF